jgi:uncharacterized membrane protein
MGSEPRPRRKWHFLQLTLFMAAWMLVAPQLRDRWLLHVLLQALLLNALLVMLWSNPEWQRYRSIVLVLWLVSLTGSLAALAPVPERWALLALAAETASLLPLMALISVGILRFVYRSRSLTIDGIFATVVVYVLIALTFARVYVLLLGWDPGSFDLGTPVAGLSPHQKQVDLLYFSLITLATVGYGDILPVSETARMLATIEAIVGQFYVAVIVAVFVGMYAAQRRE